MINTFLYKKVNEEICEMSLFSLACCIFFLKTQLKIEKKNPKYIKCLIGWFLIVSYKIVLK